MKRTIAILLILALLIGGYLWMVWRGTRQGEPADTKSYRLTEETLPPANPDLPQSKTLVKTVLSYEGEIPTSRPTRYYSYRMPYIDLTGEQAAGCNQEIEERFGGLIRQSLQAMADYRDPILEKVDFTSLIQSGILTVRVERKDYDGTESEAYYTCDAETGEAVSVEALFAAAGLKGTPQTRMNDAVLALYADRYGPIEEATVAYTTALYLTQERLFPLTANRMHLTEAGKLTVILEVFDLSGNPQVEELTLEPDE